MLQSIKIDSIHEDRITKQNKRLVFIHRPIHYQSHHPIHIHRRHYPNSRLIHSNSVTSI